MNTQPNHQSLSGPALPRAVLTAAATVALLVFLAAASAAWAKGSDTMEEQLYVTSDYTHPGEFTGGIEGPACDAQGNLYAVNYARQGTIGKVTPKGELSVFVELPSGSIGNGIRFDSHGAMLIADYTGHNVLRVDMQTRQVSVYAHEEAMNQPNDLAIGANDLVYASDPNWGQDTGQLWRANLDGTTTLLDGAMGTTNGIEVSPDGSTLYVNESVQRKVWAFDLSQAGQISNKRLLIEARDLGVDGMRCDVDGNLYIARFGEGVVAKVSPGGEVLVEVALTGRNPSNIAFGGPDGRTCYVTVADRGCIETFRVEAPGRSWQLFEQRKVPARSQTWGAAKQGLQER